MLLTHTHYTPPTGKAIRRVESTVLKLLFFFTGCECVEFSSTFGRPYGQFTSPDYPKQYDPGIGCVLYSFTAGGGGGGNEGAVSTKRNDEIVELTITTLNLVANGDPSSSSSSLS